MVSIAERYFCESEWNILLCLTSGRLFLQVHTDFHQIPWNIARILATFFVLFAENYYFLQIS